MSSSDAALSQQPSQNAGLKPATATSSARPSQQHRVSSSSAAATATAPAKPSLTIHPSATIADTALLHGTYQISIGAGVVVHPRARLYSYDGPIVIGDGCVIGEKSTIGSPTTASSEMSSPPPPSAEVSRVTTRLSSSVIIAPLATILSGAHIRSAAVIESLVIVHSYASVGAHSKVCSGCKIPENSVVDDWTVVWGSGGAARQTRRKRTVGRKQPRGRNDADNNNNNNNDETLPDGKMVEDARLVVLQKERESLAKMIGSSPSLQKKR
ncbi:hypothetical protein Egran_05686 [Elaphomyces granulatus]|uniref:Dynactin subunit 6 n=1 Tax=Elaphomyces granulatus TaxID=519963 RepID=A0A232LQU9_9EURO|nr:hypothetical protein Egran_05686 [Elaphomyces granulatus]